MDRRLVAIFAAVFVVAVYAVAMALVGPRLVVLMTLLGGAWVLIILLAALQAALAGRR